MIPTTLVQGLGSIGLFSSRAFLPAFVTAMALRYGHDIPILGDTKYFEGLPDAPTWFTHGYTLTILGLLSAVEVAGTKVPEARQMLEEVDQYVKPGMAALTFFGVMNTSDAEFVEQTVQQAGFFEAFLLLPIIAGVYYLATARNAVMSLFSEADEDDDLGVQGVLSWAEDVWSSFGILLLFIFPIVMLILIGLVSGFLVLWRKYAEYKEEKSKIACSGCGEMVYPCAMECGNCHTKVAEPRKVGFFGGSKKEAVTDIEKHPYRLVEKKRCPVCATRFEKRDAKQTCTACGHELMKDPAFAKRYMDIVGNRLPGTLVISALFSLIPVVGLIPGVIYYRTTLVAPFRRYIPFGKRFFLKWFIRILFFVLIAFQWVPGIGGVVVPSMALVNYILYRSSYEKLVVVSS